MFSSISLVLAFTVVFTITGAYALVRLALVVSGGGSHADRTAELCHLLMSLAMIAMAWGAGTGGLGGPLQIVVFGAFAVWFLVRAASDYAGHGRLAESAHALTAGAMVWMVAAMPLIMGMSMTSTSGGGHADHHGTPAAPSTGMPDVAVDTPAWVVVVTVALSVLLTAGGAFLALRAFRVTEVPVPVGAGTELAASTGEARRSPTGLAAIPGPRTDAVCHLFMNVGMASMLVAML